MTKEEAIKTLEKLEAKYKDGRDLLTWAEFNKGEKILESLEGLDMSLMDYATNCDYEDKDGFIETQELCFDGADKSYKDKLESRIEEAKALKCDFVGLGMYNDVEPVYTWLYSVTISNVIFDLKESK